MRIISNPCQEQKIKCPECKCIIGFYSYEVKKEYSICPWDEEVMGHIKFIECPLCKRKIILETTTS